MTEVDPRDMDEYGEKAKQRIHELKPGETIGWGDAVNTTACIEESGIVNLSTAVFQALGTASMCWKPIPSGIFDSTQAQKVGENLIAWINEHYVRKEPYDGVRTEAAEDRG